MDGDGRLDIVTGSDECCDRDPGFFWFKRKPGGRWKRMPKVSVKVGDGDDRMLFDSLERFRVRAVLGDWDGDGRIDLVGWHSRHPGLSLGLGPLRLDGANFAELPLIESAEIRPTMFCLVDWDRDGRLDLLVGSTRHFEEKGRPPRSSVDWYRNVGKSRTAHPVELLAFEGPEMLEGLSAADSDGDGWPDLFVGVATRSPREPYNWHTSRRFTVRAYPRRTSIAGPSLP